MKRLFLLALVASCSLTPAHTVHDRLIEADATTGTHHLHVRMVISAFNRHAHRMSWKDKGGRLVDGKPAYGIGESRTLVPTTYIKSMRLTVDGKPWPVTPRLIHHLYDVWEDRVEIRLSPDGKSAVVCLGGGDGAGGYEAQLVIRSNGKQWRMFVYE